MPIKEVAWRLFSAALKRKYSQVNLAIKSQQSPHISNILKELQLLKMETWEDRKCTDFTKKMNQSISEFDIRFEKSVEARCKMSEQIRA